MERIVLALADNGGVASAARLAAAGCTRHAIDRALREGPVVRLRRGWFALESVPAAQRAAVTAGGVLTCVSALASLDLWVLSEDALHIRVPANAVRSRSRGVVMHWREWPGCGTESDSLDGVRSSILNTIMCVPEEEAVMVLDSVVDRGVLPYGDLMALRPLLPSAKRRVLDLVDPACQSGLETRIRLAAVRLGARVRTQVFVPGVGHLDNLIGDCLSVETDGRAFHSGSFQLEEDYRRSLALHARGFVVVRLSARQVLRSWPETETVLRQLVERRAHLWTQSQRVRLQRQGWTP